MTVPVVLDGGDRRCVQLLIELRRLTLIGPAPREPVDDPMVAVTLATIFVRATRNAGMTRRVSPPRPGRGAARR